MAEDGEPHSGRSAAGEPPWEEETAQHRAAMTMGPESDRAVAHAGPVTGERRLLAAILGDALNEILRPRELLHPGDVRRADRTRNEAREWLSSGDRRSPFSFLAICDVLGLEPDYLRSQVARELRSRERRRGRRPDAARRPVSPVLRRGR